MAKLLLVVFVWTLPQFIFGQDCDIVSRYQWDARTPRGYRIGLSHIPPPYVIVHHSETPQCHSKDECKTRVKSIQNYHMDDNNWSDIGYNFLIGTDGTIFWGRGWEEMGAHAPKFNSRSIGICLIGNFGSISPPDIQITALKNLISCGVNSGKILRNYSLVGHRQVRATTCPGDRLYDIITKMDRFEPYPL